MLSFRFKEVRIENLEKNLREITGKSKGLRPDLIMMFHHHLHKDLAGKTVEIPNYIGIKWIEVYTSNFQSFPKLEDLREALYRSITLKDLFDNENLKSSILGRGIHMNMDLYDYLKENCNIEVTYYLVQEESLWKCEQIE